MEFSKAISVARKIAGVSQQDMSEAIGSCRASYNSKELNPGDFRLHEIKKLFHGLSSDEAQSLFLKSLNDFITEKHN